MSRVSNQLEAMAQECESVAAYNANRVPAGRLPLSPYVQVWATIWTLYILGQMIKP